MWRRLLERLLDWITKGGTKPRTVSVALGSGYDRESEEKKQREKICAYILSQVGTPYRLGAETALGEKEKETDCSESVQHAFHAAGLKIPDGSNYQYDFCRPVASPKPGDLGFLWSGKWGRIGHVAVYVGNGNIAHASGLSKKVVVEPMINVELSPRFKGWRRHPDFMRPPQEIPLASA